MKKTFAAILALTLMLAVLISGCGTNHESANKVTNNDNSLKPLKMDSGSIKVGMTKSSNNAPIYIAIEKGFFKEVNLDVKPNWFESSQPIAVATAGKAIDVGGMGFAASVININTTGQTIVAVADKGQDRKGYPLSDLMVPTDSPIKKVEDLKGKKIGITQIGSVYQYMAGRILEKHGLSLKDVELVPLNSISALVEVLNSKQVDSVVLNEPFVSSSVKNGFGKVLAAVGDEIGPYQGSGLFFSPEFANNKNDLAVRFLMGYVRATRYYYDTVIAAKEGKGTSSGNVDEIVSIIAKYTGEKEDVIKQGLFYIDHDGKLLVDDVKNQIDWYAKEKLIDKAVNTKDFVNTDLLNQAIKRLDEGK